MNIQSTLSTAAVLAVTATMLAAAPATANDRDVVRRGGCSGATHWKVKAGPDDGRIEVEGEIDSNRNGQHWNWRIVHNGSVSARGTGVTKAPSGSFEVRRLLVNVPGQDKIVFRARNSRSGEVCRGTVRI